MTSLINAITNDIKKKQLPLEDPKIYSLHLQPGQYYPRMARPNDQHWHGSPGSNPGELDHKSFIAIALSQLNVLTRQLEGICQVIHPTHSTFDTYGHTIRNLLILACTEVETHWRGILVENGINKQVFRTTDYSKLLGAMRLNEYSVSFPSFPWLDALSPFRNWDPLMPTISLSWYDAYNAVKHNREVEFSRATLRHAFEAVAACAIMIVSQFGQSFDGWQSSDSGRFFNFESFAKWSPADVYTFPYENYWNNGREETWRHVKYPFI
jgi:hypothetical protein